MTLKLLEGAIDAVGNYIQANMAAEIVALNAEYGDNLLENVKRYYLGNVPQELPESPSICFQGEGWTPVTQTHATLENTNQIFVWIYVGEQDAERRFRKLCRYARAVAELLNAGEASYGYTHFIAGKAQVTDTLQSPAYLQAVIMPLSVNKPEDY